MGPVTSRNQSAFLQKHVAMKEELSHRLEYIYSADRHPPTVKQAHSCSNENHFCYLPLLTDNKVKLQESCWLHRFKGALPYKFDTWSPMLMTADWFEPRETLCSIFAHSSRCSFWGVSLWINISQSVTRTVIFYPVNHLINPLVWKLASLNMPVHHL